MVIWSVLRGLLLLTILVFINMSLFLKAAFKKRTGHREASQVWAEEAQRGPSLTADSPSLCRDVDYCGACPNRCH